MTKKVLPGGQKMNFGKNRLHQVDGRAMPIGKMVSLLILPFGNPKSARGRHPYLRKLFPFVYLKLFWTLIRKRASAMPVQLKALLHLESRDALFFCFSALLITW